MERMEGLLPLEVECPPWLETALGYQGTRRWVAFYWSSAEGELRVADGVVNHSGRQRAWARFFKDAQVASHLERWGSGLVEASEDPWLLFDCRRQLLYVGNGELVAHFLQEQPLEKRRHSSRFHQAPRRTRTKGEKASRAVLEQAILG